jgi:hypothetical protein
MSSYKQTIDQLEALLMVEYGAMKAGVRRPNKTLLFSFVRVLDYLREREGED